MKSWQDYIKKELKRDPGILLLNYPYTFLWNNISETEVSKIWEKQTPEKEKVVYLHIPFCKRKCLFCNFVSYFNTPAGIIKRYVTSLKKEMEMLSGATSSFATISLCMGGGTPNILGENELEGILTSARRFMNLKKGAEMSIEIFPDETINGSKLKLLKDCGINRISLGIQSFEDRIKRICNRFDTKQQNIEIYNKARSLGFNNINFDLIFGFPEQTFKSWFSTLKLAVDLGPEHITVQPLTARHPGILFYEHMKNTDIEELMDIYNSSRDFLIKKGYSAVSRHSYVKKGFEYQYNKCCADLVPLLGLGLNSISYNSNFTYKNTRRLEEYFCALERGKLPVDKGYALKGKDRMRNYIINKIAYLKIDRIKFKNIFGRDLSFYFGGIMRTLEDFGLIKSGKRDIELTRKGVFYTALVKRCFYDFNILRAKDKFYKNIC